MALTKFPINNFRGGLNTRDSPFELMPNESPDLANVTVSSLVGQLRTREGKTRYEKSGLPNEEINHSKQVVIGSEKRFLMLSINGNIYSVDSTGAVVKRATGTAKTVWDFEVFADAAYKDWVWCCNGVDTPKKWDGEAGEAVEWKATKGTIPNGNVLCMWQNRMFLSGVTGKTQRVYFSEFADPEATIKEYGFVDVRAAEEDLDAVQDLAVLGARLFVMKRRGVFMITSPTTMLNRRVGGPGPYSRFQTAEMEDKLYWFNPQGLWSTGGAVVAMESGSINTWFPKNLRQRDEELKGARVCVTKDTYPRLLLCVAKGNPFNDWMIEMVPHINFRRIGGRRYLLLPAFMPQQIPASSIAAWNPTGYEEMLIASSKGESPFPELLTLRDTFNRAAENPLTGNWTKWAGAVNTGRINASKQWVPGEAQKMGAFWNTEEITNPAVTVELKTLAAGAAAPTVTIVCCVKNEVSRSGYGLTLTRIGATEAKVDLVKWAPGGTEGVMATLASLTVHAGDSIGLTCKAGVVTGFLKHAGEWEKIIEAADATYTKGYSGMFGLGLAEGEYGLNEFSTSEFAPNTQHLYRIFNGELDDGKPFTSYWHSAWFPLQEGESRERIRRLDVELTGECQVEVFTDFEEKARFKTKLPKLGDLEEFDEPPGVETAYRFARVRPETYGRFHAVKFTNYETGIPFQINSAEMVYRGGKQH